MEKLDKEVLVYFSDLNGVFSEKDKKFILKLWSYQDEDISRRFEDCYHSDRGRAIDMGLERLGIDKYENRLFFVYNLYRNWLECGKIEISKHLKDRFAPPPAPPSHQMK